jgi:hypothetical protein
MFALALLLNLVGCSSLVVGAASRLDTLNEASVPAEPSNLPGVRATGVANNGFALGFVGPFVPVVPISLGAEGSDLSFWVVLSFQVEPARQLDVDVHRTVLILPGRELTPTRVIQRDKYRHGSCQLSGDDFSERLELSATERIPVDGRTCLLLQFDVSAPSSLRQFSISVPVYDRDSAAAQLIVRSRFAWFGAFAFLLSLRDSSSLFCVESEGLSTCKH